jgi:hypothetical protein
MLKELALHAEVAHPSMTVRGRSEAGAGRDPVRFLIFLRLVLTDALLAGTIDGHVCP